MRDCRGEIKNATANQRAGGQLCFPLDQKTHKLGRGR